MEISFLLERTGLPTDKNLRVSAPLREPFVSFFLSQYPVDFLSAHY